MYLPRLNLLNIFFVRLLSFDAPLLLFDLVLEDEPLFRLLDDHPKVGLRHDHLTAIDVSLVNVSVAQFGKLLLELPQRYETLKVAHELLRDLVGCNELRNNLLMEGKEIIERPKLAAVLGLLLDAELDLLLGGEVELKPGKVRRLLDALVLSCDDEASVERGGSVIDIELTHRLF